MVSNKEINERLFQSKRGVVNESMKHALYDVTAPFCPKCELINPLEAKFCIKCGSNIKTYICRSCGNKNEPYAAYCSECGKKI